MRERVVERPYDDEKQWTEYKRDDVKRALRDRGWTPENAATVLDGIPDEVFQIIRAQGVEELAECYIFRMRATIRVDEAMAYKTRMWPADTEQSVAAHRARMEGLMALSRRQTSADSGDQT